MSYENGTYNGAIWLGSVKWNDDFKNVMRFQSKTVRDNFMLSHLTRQPNNIAAISSPNGFIDVLGTINDIENYNYLMYVNDSNFSTTKYHCFITDYEIIAEKTTRLFIKLDVFQQYFYDTTFFKCIVERGHISKAEDNANWNNYTTAEPIGAVSEIDRNIDIFNALNFTPVLTFDAISKPDTPAGSSNLQYSYGGKGSTPENLTGYYRFRPTVEAITQNLLTGILYFWSQGEQGQTNINHLSDLIGFNFLPEWVVNNANWSNYNANTDFVKELNNNNVVNATDTATLTINDNSGKQTLACGYAPTNKKMLTNLARGIKLYTKNGVSIPIAPNELYNKSELKIKLSMRPMGSTYKVELVNYKDIDRRYFDLQYSYNIAFGINNNVGTAQQTALEQLHNQTAILKAGQNITAHTSLQQAVSTPLKTITDIAGKGASGDVAGAGASAVTGVFDIFNLGRSFDLINAQMTADNFNYQTMLNDAVSSITASIGTNSDRTTMTNEFCKLRLADTSPTAENCRIIDDFLTVYGYAINEIKNPSNFIHSRPLFNYLKTQNINLTVPAPSDYENSIKNIFNSGVTIWHYDYIDTNGNTNQGYNNFGNYDLNNWYN